MLVWNSENVFVIQYAHDLHFACLAPLFLVSKKVELDTHLLI
jgi:hypothetical protein